MLAAADAGHRTAAAFPGFAARRGYDTIVYSRTVPALLAARSRAAQLLRAE